MKQKEKLEEAIELITQLRINLTDSDRPTLEKDAYDIEMKMCEAIDLFNDVDLASVMPRCKTCKHFKKTYDAKQSWIDRVEEAKRLYHNISEKAAVTLANNKDLWEQTESGNGFCKWHCLNEQIPDHMSCADHEA